MCKAIRPCSRNSRQRISALLVVLSAMAPVALSAQSSTLTTPPPSQRTGHASTRRAARASALDTAPANAPLSREEQASQVLNRFSFGARPGEVNEVARIGWSAWFEQQLNPSTISDAALDKRLAQYPALRDTPQQLAVEYPDGQVIRRIAEGKATMPQDLQLAGVYEVLLARFQRKQAEDKKDAAASTPSAATSQLGSAAQKGSSPASGSLQAPPMPPPGQIEGQKQARKQLQKQQDQVQARLLADQVLGYPKDQQMAAIFRLPVDQRMVLTGSVTEPEKTMLTNQMTPYEKELFGVMGGGYAGSGVIASELQQAKILRAVLSERQLQEVMTDFWFNHFNIDLAKSGDELNYAGSYERDIRAHALGKFRDLLLSTAEHPAMLIYLDNFQSIGPDSQAAGRPRPNQKNAQQRGLNENYGREVMELHTIGVDGGYTQADVTNLAKILTGWTIDQPQMGGGFIFEPKKHEPGEKKWFGQTIQFQSGPNGVNEGVAALSYLAAQPQTAHFLSYELAQRFVSDTPPPALVNRMAAAYLSSDGDISTVLRTMVHSPEFFARVNYRTKVKMPLEYLASSLRATETDPANPSALANELKVMGEPLFRCLPPTGYAPTADHWMNSAALVDRLNYALQLTSGRFGNMRFDAPRLLATGLLNRPSMLHSGTLTQAIALRTPVDAASPGGQEEALLLMEQLLVPGTVSEKTNAVIRQQMVPPEESVPTAPASMPDPSETLDKLAAMILGSPEFQVH